MMVCVTKQSKLKRKILFKLNTLVSIVVNTTVAMANDDHDAKNRLLFEKLTPSTFPVW